MSFGYNSNFIESGQILAISVGHEVSQGNLHNKILLNYDGKMLELHLAFHHSFVATEIINTDSYIWQTPKIHPFRLKNIAAKCLSIVDIQNNNVNLLPYAFGYTAKRKFNNEGLYKNYEDGDEYGMSCATFVLTVFNSFGIDLLDWKNWFDREDDEETFKRLLAILNFRRRSGQVSQIHYDNVANEKNVPKIRPEEVFSSSFCLKLPMSFESCEYLGKYIREYCQSLPIYKSV